MKLFVISFAPYDDRASVGGFDWYYDQDKALAAFEEEIRANDDTHIVRLIEFNSISSDKNSITQEIDDNLRQIEGRAIPIRQYIPV